MDAHLVWVTYRPTHKCAYLRITSRPPCRENFLLSPTVPPVRLGRTTFPLKVGCSNQLSYEGICFIFGWTIPTFSRSIQDRWVTLPILVVYQVRPLLFPQCQMLISWRRDIGIGRWVCIDRNLYLRSSRNKSNNFQFFSSNHQLGFSRLL